MNLKIQEDGATRRAEWLPLLLSIGVAMTTLACCGVAEASPEAFTIDPDHTYPSFEADHFGISVWRGKMNKTTGKVTLDRTGHSGSVSLEIDPHSIDFGQDKLNEWAIGPEFFDTAKYPQATYQGVLTHFVKGVPTQVDGSLTLHGVTKEIPLKINSFACKQHPMLKREWCGADVAASFKRDDFGLDVGKAYGFKMDVVLRIQVEAVKDEVQP
jgi:polyisoprenoid-binding protein YceI